MKIDWEKAEAMADAMTDADIGLKPGEKMFTPEEGRRAYQESVKKAKRRPGYPAALRRVEEHRRAGPLLPLLRRFLVFK